MKSKTSRVKMVLLATSAALLVSMMLVPVGFAAVGVKEGDWVRYGVFTGRYQTYLLGELPPAGNITDEFATVYVPSNLWNLTWDMPDYWPENNTEWIEMTFQSVSGNDVTVNSTTHFENGTDYTKTLSGNVETGSGSLGFFLIPAQAFEIPWDHTGVTGVGCLLLKLYINGTVSRRYAGAIREVNYVKYNYTGVGPTLVILEAYWDKTTGALCEISMSVTFGIHRVRRQFIDAWTSFLIMETNMWGPGKELEDLTADYETLQGQFNTTKSDLEEEIADLEASVDDLERTISMWQMLTIALLIVGLAVGFIIAWVVKKPKI